MRFMILCGTMTLLPGLLGCNKTQDAPTADFQPSANAEAEAETVFQTTAATESREAITVADLMEALQMKVWKEQVNEPDLPTIKRVSLCVKSPGHEPRTVTSIEIDSASQPGTLLVFIQEDACGAYPYRMGIIYRGQDGHHRSTSGPITEDPFKGVVGKRTHSGSIRRPGIAIIECNGTFRGRPEEIETTLDAAAIYVKVE